MFLLILESLGSTELFFILIMALVFFGPRKLPQLSRTLGKNLAEFRRASEDFKRTWEREVALEDISPAPDLRRTTPPEQNSIINPLAGVPPADEVVARNDDPATSIAEAPADMPVETSTADQPSPEAPHKRDWL